MNFYYEFFYISLKIVVFNDLYYVGQILKMDIDLQIIQNWNEFEWLL